MLLAGCCGTSARLTLRRTARGAAECGAPVGTRPSSPWYLGDRSAVCGYELTFTYPLGYESDRTMSDAPIPSTTIRMSRAQGPSLSRTRSAPSTRNLPRTFEHRVLVEVGAVGTVVWHLGTRWEVVLVREQCKRVSCFVHLHLVQRIAGLILRTGLFGLRA